MLITISGMVGSGKSTTAAIILKHLEEHGHQPSYVRFRYLKIFGFSRPQRQPARTPSAETAASEPVRGKGFVVRRLSGVRAAGYLMRILAFRMARTRELPGCAVVDRYFYDNFIQYRLQSPVERLYMGVLRRLIPVPDLALLLIARDDTISTRRPNYERRYIEAAGNQYRALPQRFPNLVRIDTDTETGSLDAIRRALEQVPGFRSGASAPRS